MIKYSVVICAYNEEKRIACSVNSILKQSFNSELYELIIIDNSSDDDTFEIAKNLIMDSPENAPRATLLKIKHVGLSASRNTAIQHCTGDYIAFVDGDATANVDWLCSIDNAISKSASETEVFAGAVNSLNKDSFISDFVYECHVRASADASKGSKLIGANMVFKRKVFNSVLFLDGMTRGDEASLLARYKKINPSCKELYVKDAVVLNDYPDNLSEWIKVAFTEGKMRSIIERDIIGTSKFKLFSESILRFVFLGSLFFVVFFMPFVDVWGPLLALFPLVVILRLFRTGNYFKRGVRNTLKSYRYFTILSPVVGLVLFACRDFGILLNTILKPKFIISESHSTVLDKVVAS